MMKNENPEQINIEGLNYSVMIDHISTVESGSQEIDNNYYRALWVRQQNDSTGHFLRLTPTIERAIATAALLHRTQVRKGGSTQIPYISHLLSVTEILARYTKDEATLVAGVLHDSIEDTEYTQDRLEQDFGKRVSDIVMGVTEDVEMKRAEGKEASWEKRKEKYIAHLEQASQESMLVSCADKIHNLKSMITAFEEQGDALWVQFNAPIDRKLLLYCKVLEVVRGKIDHRVVAELKSTYDQAKQRFG